MTVDQEVGDSNSPGGTSLLKDLARVTSHHPPQKVAQKVAAEAPAAKRLSICDRAAPWGRGQPETGSRRQRAPDQHDPPPQTSGEWVRDDHPRYSISIRHWARARLLANPGGSDASDCHRKRKRHQANKPSSCPPNNASARGVTGISMERHSGPRKSHTHSLFECRSKRAPRGNADQHWCSLSVGLPIGFATAKLYAARLERIRPRTQRLPVLELQ